MAEKPKPKGWNAMSKAKQDAWKKANFSSSTKVTAAQLDKLRAAKTPAAAIAKYKNDPAMREALNRFYGKDRVSKASGSASSSKQPTGPGGKMIPRPSGGPGAKMTARDGRGASSKSTSTTKSTGTTRQTAKQVTGTNAYANQAAQRRKALENMTPEQRKRADQQAAFGKNVLLPASLALLPVGKIPIVAKGATAVAKSSAGVKAISAGSKVVNKVTKIAKTKPASKTATKVVNKVTTKLTDRAVAKAPARYAKAEEQASVKAAKNASKGKHSKTQSSKSSSSSSKSGPPTPNLAGYPKLDEAKLRRILGK